MRAFRWAWLTSRNAFTTVAFYVRVWLYGGTIGRRVRSRGWVDLYVGRGGVIRIGDGVRLNSGTSANPVGAFRRTTLWIGAGATLDIGAGTGISNSTIAIRERVTIGSSVMIGGDCAIYDNDFHALKLADRMSVPHRRIGTAPVEIGRGVFVGGHSIILKGVTIGQEAVVGAASVVTRSIPAHEVWGGNPARRIGTVE